MTRDIHLLFSMVCLVLCLGVSAQEIKVGAPQTTDSEFDEFSEFDNTSTSAALPVSDPLIHFNRFMFQVNDRLYFWAFKPVAKGYAAVVPERPRVAVRHFFRNLGFPVRVVNCCLQGKIKDAGAECVRFGINTTLGILGFMDPAEAKYSLRPRDEDFGQTLGHYGAGAGFYIVLPLLGPSNVRDVLGRIPDYFLDPVSYLDPSGVRVGVRIYERENYLSLNLNEYDELKKAALDPYTFVRDIYSQNRLKRIEQ